MSDGYPWGIWITYDVATGTAIACGGYAVAILVYIRNRMQYHPLIRSAILTSMFGYGLAGFSVMVDLGRPWNSYNFFLPSKWQVNSVMFEVALCVMAYSTVLIIEFLPAMLTTIENSQWQRLRAVMDWLHPLLVPDRDKLLTRMEWVRSAAAWLNPRLDKALIFIIVLGITLPTMHQSSLGSMLLIASTKLHPLWHTGFLPLLFLINCVYIGYSIAILESIISSYAFRRPFEVNELAGLAGIVPWLAASG
jgi:Ni/Fe-hydrogenase subunit HybB-like protein